MSEELVAEPPVAPQPVEMADYIDSGNFKEGWETTLGEGHDGMKKFTSVDSLAKSYVNLEKMIGANTVKVPSEKDGPDAMDKYYQAVGKPETFEGYGIDAPEGLDERIQWNSEDAAEFNKFAHDNDFTQKQRDALIVYDNNRMLAGVEDQTELTNLQGYSADAIKALMSGDEAYRGFKDTATAEMNTEFGENGMQNAQRAAMALGMESLLNDPIIGNSKEFVTGMIKVAGVIGESQLPVNEAAMGTSGLEEAIGNYYKPGTQENADFNSSNTKVANAAAQKLTQLNARRYDKD